MTLSLRARWISHCTPHATSNHDALVVTNNTPVTIPLPMMKNKSVPIFGYSNSFPGSSRSDVLES